MRNELGVEGGTVACATCGTALLVEFVRRVRIVGVVRIV